VASVDVDWDFRDRQAVAPTTPHKLQVKKIVISTKV
jgi:hypothetical protein